VPTKEQIISAIEDYCRFETEKNKEGWLALFAPDASHEDPVGLVRNDGLEKIAAFWDGFQPWNVHLRLVEPPIVCGVEAVALMEATTGPDNDRRTSPRIVDQMIFTEDGKIKAVRAFYNYG